MGKNPKDELSPLEIAVAALEKALTSEGSSGQSSLALEVAIKIVKEEAKKRPDTQAANLIDMARWVSARSNRAGGEELEEWNAQYRVKTFRAGASMFSRTGCTSEKKNAALTRLAELRTNKPRTAESRRETTELRRLVAGEVEVPLAQVSRWDREQS